MRKAEISLTCPLRKRRTSKEVEFDSRWKLRYIFPEYISTYFIINLDDILNAKDRWKDLVIDIIRQRERIKVNIKDNENYNLVDVYNSIFIPENNI